VAIRKPDPVALGVDAGAAAADGWMQGLFPTLWGYLSDLRYEDGSPRQTATLMLLAEQGVVKACLNDRDNDRSVWVSGRGVEEALSVLEAALLAGRAEWRGRPPSRGPGRPRK